MGKRSDARNGNELFQQVVDATGLPAEHFSIELQRLLEQVGAHRDHMTLEHLREAALFYLREMISSETSH